MSSWHDADGDGLEDDLKMLQEGLAAPYGIVAYRTTVAGSEANEFLVAHKPDIMHLVNEAPKPFVGQNFRRTVAEGWGYNDDYHDWTCGIVRLARTLPLRIRQRLRRQEPTG